MARLNLYSESEENQASFGGLGIRVLTGAAVAGEHFYHLKALEASSITATNNLGGDATLTALSLPAGEFIVGDFSAVTVNSGTVIGYLLETP